VPSCKSFLVTEAEWKHVRRFQQHRHASCHQDIFFFLQGKTPKKIHAILTETLGEHASSYATVKNWVAQFKRGDFSTCDAPRIDCLHMQNGEDLGFKLRKPTFKYRPEKQLSSLRFFAVSLNFSKFLDIALNARTASFHIFFYSSYHKTVQARV